MFIKHVNVWYYMMWENPFVPNDDSGVGNFRDVVSQVHNA